MESSVKDNLIAAVNGSRALLFPHNKKTNLLQCSLLFSENSNMKFVRVKALLIARLCVVTVDVIHTDKLSNSFQHVAQCISDMEYQIQYSIHNYIILAYTLYNFIIILRLLDSF
jgi:hypothetical protein